MLYFFKIYSRNVGKRCRSLLVKLIKQAFIKIYICILIFTSILGGLLSIFVFVFKFLSVFLGELIKRSLIKFGRYLPVRGQLLQQ